MFPRQTLRRVSREGAEVEVEDWDCDCDGDGDGLFDEGNGDCGGLYPIS